MIVNYKIFASAKEFIKFYQSTDFKYDYRQHEISEDSLEKLEFGDSYNVEELKAELKTFGDRKVIAYDFYGKRPVVQKAIIGNPYCFQNMKSKKRLDNKYITIVYDQGVPCNYPSRQIIENGKKMLGTLKFLEQSGYRIRLFATVCAYNSEAGDINLLMIKVKDYDDPFSLTRIAFGIANPNFLRDVFLGWCDKDKVATYELFYGYPVTKKFSEETMSLQLSSFLGKGIVYVTQYMVQDEKDFTKRLLEQSQRIVSEGYENSKTKNRKY